MSLFQHLDHSPYLPSLYLSHLMLGRFHAFLHLCLHLDENVMYKWVSYAFQPYAPHSIDQLPLGSILAFIMYPMTQC